MYIQKYDNPVTSTCLPFPSTSATLTVGTLNLDSYITLLTMGQPTIALSDVLDLTI